MLRPDAPRFIWLAAVTPAHTDCLGFWCFSGLGREIYFGPTTGMLPYFEGLGLKCPSLMNPADFVRAFSPSSLLASTHHTMLTVRVRVRVCGT